MSHVWKGLREFLGNPLHLKPTMVHLPWREAMVPFFESAAILFLGTIARHYGLVTALAKGPPNKNLSPAMPIASLRQILLFGLVAALPAVAQSPFESAIAQAKKRAAQGQIDEAIVDLQALVRENDRDPHIRTALAALLLVNKDPEAALAQAEAAVQIAPTHANAILERAAALSKLGRAESAESDFARAIELDPGSARAWGMRGDHRREKGDLEQCIVDYDAAIRLFPAFAQARLGRGLALLRLGDPAAARKDFSALLQLGYEKGLVLNSLALSEWELGNDEAALKRLDASLRVQPDHMDTILLRHAVLIALDRPAEATRVIEDVAASSMDAGVRAMASHRLGVIAMCSGDMAKAAECFGAARKARSSMAGWASLMMWAVLVEQDALAAVAALPGEDEPDEVVRTIAAMLRDGRGDSEALPMPGWKAEDAGMVLFFSALRARAEGRHAEAENKLLRCVNEDGETHQAVVAMSMLIGPDADRQQIGLGCEVGLLEGRGLVVRSVTPYGVASLRGLREGDVIVKVRNQPATLDAWQSLPCHTRPWRTCTIVVRRGQDELRLKLKSGLVPTEAQRSFVPAAGKPLEKLRRKLEFTATVPEGWKEGPLSPTSLRSGLQYTIGNGTEVKVARIGMSVHSSLDFWRENLGLQPLDESAVASLPRVEFLGDSAVLLECEGTWSSMGAKPLAEARLIVVVQADKGGVVYGRCVGPRAEVLAAREAILSFFASVRHSN